MKFSTPKVPFQLARHTLCIVKKGRNWRQPQGELGTDSMLRLFPGLKTEARSGALAVSGPLIDAGEKLGVLLFYSSNQVQIQAQLENANWELSQTTVLAPADGYVRLVTLTRRR